ncbi:MAG TPA: hypothetical protein V6D29_05640 [Leptolyngbyaceae cyanobacterium]
MPYRVCCCPVGVSLAVAFSQSGLPLPSLASAAVARLLPASKALTFTPVGFRLGWLVEIALRRFC